MTISFPSFWRIFGRVESSKASELVSRRFSTERLRQSLKVQSRKSTTRKSKTTTPEESVSASVMPKLPPSVCNEIPHIFELKQQVFVKNRLFQNTCKAMCDMSFAMLRHVTEYIYKKAIFLINLFFMKYERYEGVRNLQEKRRD